MKVCIAEKPSVAREIANVLGASSRREGYFEGNGYQVTWTFGHLCTLKEPSDYHAQFKSWSLQMLPIIPPRFGIKLIEDGGVRKQFRVIEQLVAEAEEVINCGDAGQEGEVIQRWVLSKAKCKAPVRRLWISSLTKEAIEDGFKNLKPGSDFEKLYAAGSSRAIGDWMLGINATRAYTLKYGGGKGVLSIGRVQTPTLALLVSRQLEIDRFKPEPYWELKTKYREVLFSAKAGRYAEQAKAQAVLEKIKEKPFRIVSFEQKEGKELPPALFDLTALQVAANKKHGFSAEQTLKLVQSLYEKKLVTYPRVDTTYLPNDIYPKIGGILRSLVAPYAELAGELLAGGPLRKSKKVFNDKKVTDHHAIIPTNVAANMLQGGEVQVYDLIARRFLSVFFPDCLVSKTAVLGEVEKEVFRATGKQILSDGWRKVFKGEKPDEDDKSSETGQVMPQFTEGESGGHEPLLAQKQTKPPKYYTEATLLRAMETAGKQVESEELREAMKENGIGRPSTRANIIETLFKRKYVQRVKKNLQATSTGIQLIQTVRNDLLKSAELTGQWEHKLRLIEKGDYEVGDFIQEMRNLTGSVVREVKMASSAVIPIASEAAPKEKKKPEAEALLCPKCKQGTVLKGSKAYGCSRFREGCDFRLPFALSNKKLTKTQLKDLVGKGKTRLIKGIQRGNEKVAGWFVLDETFNILIEEKPAEKPEVPEVCPKCGGKVVKGKTAYGCSNWKAGCDFRFSE
ncbi:MAG: DNA topoisomerase 3 [Cytophagales bacterium]|nr:DNA topoisomerase 3 [Cytophagales bacterium]